MHHGRPVIGAINQPVLKQLVIGDGDQTTLNGKPISGRPACKLEQATLCTTDPFALPYGKTVLNGLIYHLKLRSTALGEMLVATFCSAQAS